MLELKAKMLGDDDDSNNSRGDGDRVGWVWSLILGAALRHDPGRKILWAVTRIWPPLLL